MRMAGKCERHAARFGIVEMIGVMRHQKMRRTVARNQSLPVRLAHDPIVDAAQHKTIAVMRENNAVVLERLDADGSKIVLQLGRVAAEIVVIAETKPRAERRVREAGQGLEIRSGLAHVAGDQVAADDDQVGLGLH